MVQEEVDGRIDTAVEESQAAGDQESVSLPRLSITTELSVGELWDDDNDFENIKREPGHHKGHDDGQDHFDWVPTTSLSSRIGSTVLVQMHNDGAIADSNDQHWEHKGQ